jgi:hypothetical protein
VKQRKKQDAERIRGRADVQFSDILAGCESSEGEQQVRHSSKEKADRADVSLSVTLQTKRTPRLLTGVEPRMVPQRR